MDTSPKRVTRARAAAKTGAVRTTRIITAAARAKATPAPAAAPSTRTTTAVKRKTREYETDDDEDTIQKDTKTTRTTRPRAAAQQEETSARLSRGRPAKKQATDTTKAQAGAPSGPAARGRLRKSADPGPSARTTTTTRGRLASAAAKPPVKKSVKFQDTDKENVAPAPKKEPNTAGLRGRPARRGGSATAARSTRKTAATATAEKASSAKEEKKPLSPRKVTQIPVPALGDGEEDELAGEDEEQAHPIMKSPVRPPKPNVKEAEGASSHQELDDDATVTVNDAILNAPNTLCSPAKRAPAASRDTIRSPARKIGAVPFPVSAMKSGNEAGASSEQLSPSKNMFLHSAAKRPPSPIKGLTAPSPFNDVRQTPSAVKMSMLQSPAKRSVPGFKPVVGTHREEPATEVAMSPAMKPLAASMPSFDGDETPSEKLMMDYGHLENEEDNEEEEEEPFKEPIAKIKFPGRLSAVLPRDADPAVEDEPAGEQEQQEDEGLVDQVQPLGDEVLDDGGIPEIQVDEPSGDIDATAASGDITPPHSHQQHKNPMYQLRQKDLNPCNDLDSELESESGSPDRAHQATPTTSFSKKNGRRSTIGLTSLAEQFGSWSAASPAKEPATGSSQPETAAPTPSETPAAASHYFDDEMQSRSELPDVDVVLDEDLTWSEEDLAFAREAEGMSHVSERQEGPIAAHLSHDDGLSDASQEYGDENQVPVDPVITAASTRAAPVTPERPERQQAFFPHTTTKIPLKPADDSTPSPLKKGYFSASRVSGSRGGLAKSASAPSLSPSKRRRVSSTPRRASTSSTPATPTPKTPTMGDDDSFSSAGTPGLTRPDLNPDLLRGAVVFVEARTSDGGDASGLFTDLLKQMGARCRKTWNWNPRNSATGETSDKVGITHVVYKDGRPQTLEKVRRAHGLVQCVGVSWVLDCERENKWLEEGPYYVDSSLTAQGSSRRRKSMEPRVLENMNGTLYDGSSSKGQGSGANQTPARSMKRRDSTMWTRTPSDQGDQDQDQDQDDIDWSKYILTPVPKTPAPEAIAKYASEIPETPSGGDGDEPSYLCPPTEDLMTRTCPPKSLPIRQDMGRSLFGSRTDSDEQVVQRLMAAKRKSLQFAPKIASPLSRTWN